MTSVAVAKKRFAHSCMWQVAVAGRSGWGVRWSGCPPKESKTVCPPSSQALAFGQLSLGEARKWQGSRSAGNYCGNQHLNINRAAHFHRPSTSEWVCGTRASCSSMARPAVENVPAVCQGRARLQIRLANHCMASSG